MKAKLNQVDPRDAFILGGLALVSTGLWLAVGLWAALLGSGTFFLVLGLWLSVTPSGQPSKEGHR